VGASSGVAVATSALLEREQQLAALERHLAAVTTSQVGRFVFVGGEAGVGKSSLVRRFCSEWAVRVLSGACDALATPHPLGPFLDIAALSGSMNDLIAGGALPYEVAASLLEELRAGSPSILVLEDLHWADDATLDVVRLLARRVETVPVLVVGTYRDDQVDRTHRLRILIGELATWPGVARLSLTPLSARAVAELAAPHGVDATELYRNTGGNPFFVSEVLAAGGSRLPQTVQDAVLARAARLAPAARRVVEAVAIVPAGTDFGLLEALEPRAMDSVEECLASGVLTSTATGVAFRHELARIAVEISLPPNRRIALHRAALAALSVPARGPADSARLAHHAEAAADPEAVLRFAPAAAASAARVGAHREAAAQYGRALRFGQNLAPERRAELLSQRSTECHLIGDYREAIETRKAAVEVYRLLGERLREGDALRAMSANLRCFGLVPEAAEAGRAALEVLEQVDPGPELALAYANSAMLALNVEDAVATRTWGAKAYELAEQIDDRASFAHAMNSIGTVGYLLGDEDGRLALERSLDLCKRWSLREQAGRAYIHLAWASVRRRDYVRAAAYCQDGIDYCLEHGLDAWRFEILGHQARRLLDQGTWEEATEATATILGSPNTNAVARVLALTVLALLRSRRGDPDHDSPMQEARAIAAPTGELQLLLPVATATAEIAWLGGDLAAIAAADSATGEVLHMAERHGATSAISEVAAWRRRCGLQAPGPAGDLGPYERELAGDPAAAAAVWLDLDCEYDAAIALCAGDSEQHRQALEIFQRLEARPAAAIAARLLREEGVRGVPRGPRPSTKRNPAGLTNRELEVLGLIGQELRNREIARRLHVAEKTVDHHVGAILAKLGVSSRGQAASTAARLGIGPS
jgi:DNA-binding CsgD family transcriptional regulator